MWNISVFMTGQHIARTQLVAISVLLTTLWSPNQNLKHTTTLFSLSDHDILRDAPFDIWGGGLEFLLLANFFFYLRWKTSFFLAINVR